MTHEGGGASGRHVRRLDPEAVAAEAARVAEFRRRAVLRLLFLLGAVGFAVLTLVSPFRQLLAQESRIAEAHRQTAALEARNDRLDARLRELGRDTTIERLAREELGLVKPGEEAYVVLAPPPPAPAVVVAGALAAPPATGVAAPPPPAPPAAPPAPPPAPPPPPGAAPPAGGVGRVLGPPA